MSSPGSIKWVAMLWQNVWLVTRFVKPAWRATAVNSRFNADPFAFDG